MPDRGFDFLTVLDIDSRPAIESFSQWTVSISTRTAEKIVSYRKAVARLQRAGFEPFSGRSPMSWMLSILLMMFLAGKQGRPAQPPQIDLTAQVDKLFEKWNKLDSPGCALSVIKEGRIVYERGYGMADLDHDIRITPSSVFHVASMSKQFTALTILLLEQQGKLSLDDDVRTYIPELPDFGQRITIRHLIHHTSGLRDQWDLLGLAGWRYSLDLITDDDVLSLMARQKDLNFRPGDRFLYCNTGYTLLAQIVKRVSGQSFRAFTTANIFEPLGMKNTHFRDDHAEIVKGMAYGYVPSGATFKLSITNFDTVGATSLLTTVEDLALWDENFYNPRVGGKPLIERMLERGRLNSGEPLNYAFGLTLGKYRGLAIVDHAGSDAGYRSDLLRFPDQHFSVVCLCNVSINPSQLTRQVADIYLAAELTPEAPKAEESAVKLTEAQLAGKAGIFHHREDDGIRRIIFQDGSLRSIVQGAVTIELKPLSETRFRAAGQTVESRFEPMGDKGMRLIEVPDSGEKPIVYERAEEFKPTPTKLQDYVGVYQSEEIEPIYRLAIRDGKLVLERLKSKPTPLEPAIRDVFTNSLGSLRFVRNPAGHVTGFILNRGRILGFRFKKVTGNSP
jgi:CubicO group peptidase (beta-lactamase class C family)